MATSPGQAGARIGTPWGSSKRRKLTLPPELSVAPSPRPSEASRVRLGTPSPRPPPPFPLRAARKAQGKGDHRVRGDSFPSAPSALEAWAKRSCPGERCCAPSAQARGWLPSPAFGKNTYSRATQGGSGSGRCAIRRRLQSSRSPRQRQGAGHRRSAATPRLMPAAGPARPNSAHSSSPSAAAGARSFGAPIAVPRPLARPCAPQPARARSPAPTSSRG